MILRIIGNKSKIAMQIQTHFPKHKIYVEPFFGAGGMFFNKLKAKYNLVNDIDSDVFNLYQVVSNQLEDLQEALTIMPVHQDLLKHWKTNKETEPIKKAIRFLFLSNYTYLGKQDILRSSPDNSKAILISRLKETNKLIFDVQFFNIDYLQFLNTLSLDSRKRLLTSETFIYADPPYIGTEMSIYENGNKWKKENATELVNTLIETKCKWCMSEFDHPHILQLVKEHNLNLIYIGERRNLKNKRTEVIVTNYKLHNTLF